MPAASSFQGSDSFKRVQRLCGCAQVSQMQDQIDALKCLDCRIGHFGDFAAVHDVSIRHYSNTHALSFSHQKPLFQIAEAVRISLVSPNVVLQVIVGVTRICDNS